MAMRTSPDIAMNFLRYQPSFLPMIELGANTRGALLAWLWSLEESKGLVLGRYAMSKVQESICQWSREIPQTTGDVVASSHQANQSGARTSQRVLRNGASEACVAITQHAVREH